MFPIKAKFSSGFVSTFGRYSLYVSMEQNKDNFHLAFCDESAVLASETRRLGTSASHGCSKGKKNRDMDGENQ